MHVKSHSFFTNSGVFELPINNCVYTSKRLNDGFVGIRVANITKKTWSASEYFIVFKWLHPFKLMWSIKSRPIFIASISRQRLLDRKEIVWLHSRRFRCKKINLLWVCKSFDWNQDSSFMHSSIFTLSKYLNKGKNR